MLSEATNCESEGQNDARVATIEKRYDPANLFRVNQNIKPAK
jgi:hypothetical protein